MATHASPQVHQARTRGDSATVKTDAATSTSRATAAWVGLFTLALGGTLVFWLFDALPFQDLPAHAGLIALRHHFADWSVARRSYVLDPHLGPYSLFRGLGELLVVPLGPVGAVRALATLPLLATPAALLWSRRRLHGDRSPTAGYFGLALGFGYMTLLGFAAYLLAVALVVVTLTVWLELLAAVDRGASTRRHEVVVALLAPLTFLAHGDAFVVLLVLAIISALATGTRARRLVRLRAFVPALAIAAWAGWAAGSVEGARGATDVRFHGVAEKLGLLLTPTLLTHTGIDALVAVGLWAVIGAAFFASLRATASAPSGLHTRALAGCVVVVLGAFLLLPHAIGWFGFVDGRLVPLLLLLALMGVRLESLGPRLRAAFDRTAPIAAGTMVVIALVASALFQAEARGWREVLAAVPAGARLLNLPLEPNSDVLAAHPFIHYDKLVLVDRPVVLSDVWFHQGSALFPAPGNPAMSLPAGYSESDLRSIDWPTYRLQDWDYVLIRTRPSSAQPATPPALTLRAHEGGWWLFTVAGP
jgi:hypothetical protein